MKKKIIIYITIGVILFLSASFFIKYYQYQKLQQEYAKQDFEQFQDKVIIANKKIRDLKILNKNLSKDLELFESEYDLLNINNINIEKKLKAKKAELKIEGQTIQELLTKNIQLNLLHEENEYRLDLTIKNLLKQRDAWKQKYDLKCIETIQYKNLYLDCSDKYQKLYKLKFKKKDKFKYISIVQGVGFLAYLILKK